MRSVGRVHKCAFSVLAVATYREVLQGFQKVQGVVSKDVNVARKFLNNFDATTRQPERAVLRRGARHRGGAGLVIRQSSGRRQLPPRLLGEHPVTAVGEGRGEAREAMFSLSLSAVCFRAVCWPSSKVTRPV